MYLNQYIAQSAVLRGWIKYNLIGGFCYATVALKKRKETWSVLSYKYCTNTESASLKIKQASEQNL